MEKAKVESIYTLTMKNVYALIAFYFVIIVGGIIYTIYVLANINTLIRNYLLMSTGLISITFSATLCSIQYLKRIYKACINDRIKKPEPCDKSAKIGYLLYFLLRPVYASAFSLIAIFAMLAGIVIVTSSVDIIINERFMYLSAIVSCLIGYSIGKVMDTFERISSSKLDKMLKMDEGA